MLRSTKTLAVLFSIAVSTAALAHPSISVVIDSRGNVFYSDLHDVWRIAADGRKSIAVPNVHTHELYLDANDNLYGEHLWYEGDATKQWGHRVWKRAADGRITTIIPATRGFLEGDNYSFVRDRAGNMYWLDRDGAAVRERRTDGRVVTVARRAFTKARWLMSTADGVLYLVDGTDLLRIANGRFSPVAPNATSAGFVGGIWTDAAANLFIGDYADRAVKKVDARGRVSVVARSSWPWGPTGGAFDRNGDLWLLEWSVTNAARVRRIPHGRAEH